MRTRRAITPHGTSARLGTKVARRESCSGSFVTTTCYAARVEGGGTYHEVPPGSGIAAHSPDNAPPSRYRNGMCVGSFGRQDADRHVISHGELRYTQNMEDSSHLPKLNESTYREASLFPLVAG